MSQNTEVGENYRPLKSTVIRNAARCDVCKDVIESVHRHDFKGCRCQNVMVDGGLAYVRRVFTTDQFTDLSIYRLVEMTNDEIQRHHELGFF